MRLYLDTTSNKQTIVRLDDLEKVQESGIWHSQVVLPVIEELLQKKKAALKDITEIKVKTGPGSFTGVRVGVSIAQALGYALNIPVNGKQPAKLEAIKVSYN